MTTDREQRKSARRPSRRSLLGWSAALAGSGFLIGSRSAAAQTGAVAKTAVTMPDWPFSPATKAGPSSATVGAIGRTPSVPGTPYLLPTASGWSSTSLLTVGNAAGGYRLSGNPDGLGAVDNGDGTITVFVNHEIDATHSVERGHGATGSFVSRWVINKATLEVISGRDFVASPDNLMLWQQAEWKPASSFVRAATAYDAATPVAVPDAALPPDRPFVAVPAIDRLCSADLARTSAFYNQATGLGHNGPIFLNGEEGADRVNRAFAWVLANETCYQLAAFSFGTPRDKERLPPAWENLLANPSTGDATVVIGNSDGGPSEVYVYIGRKGTAGTPVDKAGLTNGAIYALRVKGSDQEQRRRNIGLSKTLRHGRGKRVALVPPYEGTGFQRPEDGAWDPRYPNVYYFATTDQNNFAADGSVRAGSNPKQTGRSRLWAVTFDDVAHLKTDGTAVGSIELLLDGTEGGDMFDNITVDANGIIYLCEDTGDSRHAGKIWSYNTNTGALQAIFRFDPELFGDIVNKRYVPPRAPFTDDKETSGILDVTQLFADAPWMKLGATVLLVSVQAHFDYDSADPLGYALYEGGQLVLLTRVP